MQRKIREKEGKKEGREGRKEVEKKVLHIISCKNGHCRVLRKHYYFNAQCAIVPVISTEGISYQMKTS